MASKSNTLTNAIKSKSKNSLTKSNCFTESEFYMYDNIAMAVKDDFEKTNTSIYRFIPTIEDLKAIHIERHVREYAPFIIYLINHLAEVKKNEDDAFSEEELAIATETKSFLMIYLKVPIWNRSRECWPAPLRSFPL